MSEEAKRILVIGGGRAAGKVAAAEAFLKTKGNVVIIKKEDKQMKKRNGLLAAMLPYVASTTVLQNETCKDEHVIKNIAIPSVGYKVNQNFIPSKTPLTNKQLKARAKNKQARKARKIHRVKNWGTKKTA